MVSKQRPPLAPTDSTYVGLAQIAGAAPAVEARHLLRWPSRSRPGKEHFSSCDERGGDVRCTCEAWTYRGACGHAAGHLDALAHHGVTFGPPADPGGASACRPCWHCPTRAYCAEHGCRYDFAASGPGPGGAAGEPPELAGLTECEDAARDERKRRYTESMANLYGG